ncbi:hypothetical protein QYM36_017651 [Artemia franciscana]|uniref:Uncharacterized protein n=1 Tax=Artemia franciscana TaxID=6661 RepID=A0AA88HDE9_ARTSF|nr:hypothetical protein QYM36_018197 [Artemia franciscana]KAK2704030.1 hypothetical protein QYM36_017647 [Artemia franciscana]KAK2704034.1 hypothetical protein QYM36_017651 [Artemia franciscana]
MLADMHATGDEKRQLEATDRMASFMLHNNEESLPAFPVRQVVSAVSRLLSKEEEENFFIVSVHYIVTSVVEVVLIYFVKE